MKTKTILIPIIYLFVWIFIWNISFLESAELPRVPSSTAFQSLSQMARPEFRRRTESFLGPRIEQVPTNPTIRGNPYVPEVPVRRSPLPFTQTAPVPMSRIQSRGTGRYVPGEIIIKLRRDVNIQGFREGPPSWRVRTSSASPGLESLNRRYSVRSMDKLFQAPDFRIQSNAPRGLELWRIYRLRFRSDLNPEEVARDYERLAEVEYAEPNYIYTISFIPNDPLFPRQYALQRSQSGIDAVEAWDIETGSSRIMVGLLDTGVDYNHEDLKGRIVKGPNFVNEGSDPMDDQGHGTHIAGIIAARGNNGKGVAGLCWSCQVMAIKVADVSGASTNAWIAQGLVYAVNHGTQIVNLSLGGFDPSKTLEQAVRYANSRNVVLVAAIGNESTSQAVYPAAYPGVIAVGATDVNGGRASFSNFGDYLFLMAPGVSILSTYRGNSYQGLSGTSMSAGFISGVAALILSKNPSLSSSQVRRILAASTDDLGTFGKDPETGYGKINAYKALGGGAVSMSNYQFLINRWRGY